MGTFYFALFFFFFLSELVFTSSLTLSLFPVGFSFVLFFLLLLLFSVCTPFKWRQSLKVHFWLFMFIIHLHSWLISSRSVALRKPPFMPISDHLLSQRRSTWETSTIFSNSDKRIIFLLLYNTIVKNIIIFLLSPSSIWNLNDVGLFHSPLQNSEYIQNLVCSFTPSALVETRISNHVALWSPSFWPPQAGRYLLLLMVFLHCD